MKPKRLLKVKEIVINSHYEGLKQIHELSTLTRNTINFGYKMWHKHPNEIHWLRKLELACATQQRCIDQVAWLVRVLIKSLTGQAAYELYLQQLPCSPKPDVVPNAGLVYTSIRKCEGTPDRSGQIAVKKSWASKDAAVYVRKCWMISDAPKMVWTLISSKKFGSGRHVERQNSSKRFHRLREKTRKNLKNQKIFKLWYLVSMSKKEKNKNFKLSIDITARI